MAKAQEKRVVLPTLEVDLLRELYKKMLRVYFVEERVKHWLGRGAQPTDRVLRFLDSAGLAKREARVNPTKAQPGKKRVEREEAKRAAEEEKAKAAAEAAAAPAEEPAAEAEQPAAEAEQPAAE